jgi:hypothetical protein
MYLVGEGVVVIMPLSSSFIFYCQTQGFPIALLFSTSFSFVLLPLKIEKTSSFILHSEQITRSISFRDY